MGLTCYIRLYFTSPWLWAIYNPFVVSHEHKEDIGGEYEQKKEKIGSIIHLLCVIIFPLWLPCYLSGTIMSLTTDN